MNLQTTDTSKLVARQTLKPQKTLSLADLRKPTGTKTIILADISGSMIGTKITNLKTALERIWRPGITGIAFESDLWQFTQKEIHLLSARGSTNMYDALQEAWKLKQDHIILLTDGHPNGGPNAIIAATKLHPHPPIDTIGIGQDCNHAMLQEISRITKGRYNDVQDPVMLTQTMTMLLSFRPDEQTQKGGSIQL